MELRQLRYFLAVVEAGSFTAAAVTLHMSQPPLSLAIAKLEQELGVKLLSRSARGVRATSAGMYLVEAATRILDEVDDVQSYLARYGTGAAGLLRVAAVPVLMWRRIPEFLRAHASDYAEVDVRLVDPPPWVALEMVLDRKVDLAFIAVADAARLADQYSTVLRFLDWGDVELVAVFPPEEQDLPDPVDLQVFENRVFVLPRRAVAVPSIPEVVDDLLTDNNISVASLRTVETVQTSMALVEAGLAVSIMPDADRRSLDHTTMVVRSIAQDIPSLQAVAVFRADLEPSPALTLMLDRVKRDGRSRREGE